MGRPVFAYGVVPFVKPVAFQRDLPIVPTTVVMERGMCVFFPTPSSNLTSLPSFPFSFTPSQLCSLTHSQPGRKKLAEPLLSQELPSPTLTQAARAFATHSREPLFRSAEETWRWFIRRFIVCHSMDFLICYLHIKVMVLSAFCDYFLRASFSSFYCKTMYFL